MIPAFTSANLLAWALQAGAVVLVGAVAIRAASLELPRARLTCFRVLLAGCLLLPLLAVRPVAVGSTVGPSDLRTVGSSTTSSGPTLSVDVTPASSSRAGSSSGALAAWLPDWTATFVVVAIGAGIFARLSWLAVGLIGLRRLRRNSRKTVGAELCSAQTGTVIDRAIGLAGVTAEIRTSAAVSHPVTFGVRRPVVLLPDTFASLDESEQVSVLCHELLHVRRRDWLQTLAEEVVRAFVWFHPAIWWLLAQIDLSREQVVDQEVVALTERRDSYLHALVTLALMPAGPVLRPASLFLGRAQLLRRVALLSKEVRMSRRRVVVSMVLVIAALALGSRLMAGAFPLAAATPASMSSVSAQAPATPVQQRRTYAEAIQRPEPAFSPAAVPPGNDVIVTAQITVGPNGLAQITGPVALLGGTPDHRWLEGSAAGGATLVKILERDAQRTATAPYAADAARAAFNVVSTWQFLPPDQPFTTAIGFNLARTDQSGPDTQPMRVGTGGAPQPRRIRSVNPVYPEDAQQKRIQGVVIIELTIDAAGIPVSGYAVRPIQGLSLAAVQAALQWRFTPSAEYPRRLMTVTVNFSLSGGTVVTAPGVSPPPRSGVVNGVRGGIAGGVPGGVAGGVEGGVSGGVTGGVESGTASFGPPPAEWPSNAVRVGGNIKQPTRLKNVAPIYPPDAQTARVQGIVIVEALIGTDGNVVAGRVLRGMPMLNQAALDAVQQWEYSPTLMNGMPIPVVMVLTVNFRLE